MRRSLPHSSPLRDDRGSTLLLTIFYAFLALAVILMVVAASSLYLERKRLFTLADAAALVGAEAFAAGDVRVTGSQLHATLDSTVVDGAVREFLASTSHHGFHELTLERAAALDGSSATVELAAVWRPPVLALFMPDGVRLQVTAVARSILW